MGNCVLKVLKESVNDNSLMKLNECQVYIDRLSTGSIKMNRTDIGQLRAKSDGTIIELSASTPLVFSNLAESGYYYYSDKNATMPIKGDTDLCDGLTLNISDFAGIPENTLRSIDFRAQTIYGNVEDLQPSGALYRFEIEYSQIIGTLSQILAKFPRIGNGNDYFNTGTCPNITGTTGDLAVMLFSPNRFWLAPKISGNLYDAIEGNGTTTGWRRTWGGLTSTRNQMMITDEGLIHLWSVYPPKNTPFKLDWTDTTTSITVNGVTTTFDNQGNIIS